MNQLLGDLDFFKKLLSWFLIGYIFYQVSFSKIFIGIRLKIYDLLFILAFSLIAIPKALLLYSDNIDFFNNYYIFKGILNYLKLLHGNYEIIVSFLAFIGILLGIILVISLISNYSYKKNSFLGSFKFNDTFLSHFISYILLILYSLFLGLIVFNLFMEWFALAVDSVILVLGLIYYLILYLHKHTKINTNFIGVVSNSGNNFIKNLIEMFSNKKTFFIGVSFLLVLHLLVDAGVYMVPYVVGTENALYSGGEIGGNDPLFNFLDFTQSLIYSDLTQTGASDFFVTSAILLIYFIAIFLGFSLLILPFYILYKNIGKQKIYLDKYFVLGFLSSVLFYLFYKFIVSLNFPLDIATLTIYEGVRGVNIITSSIISSNITYDALITSVLLYLIIFIFLLFKYDKYSFFYKKCVYLIVGCFFVLYIGMFFISVVSVEYSHINDNFFEKNTLDYKNLELFSKEIISLNSKNFTVEGISYYGNNLKFHEIPYIKNNIQYDFVYGKLNEIKNKTFNFGDSERLYLFENSRYDLKSNLILSKKFEFLYYVGNNISEVINGSVNQKTSALEINNLLIKKVEKKKFLIGVYLDILRFILLSMFYIFGTLTFIWFYTKKNILDL